MFDATMGVWVPVAFAIGPGFFSAYPVALRWDFGVSLGVVW